MVVVKSDFEICVFVFNININIKYICNGSKILEMYLKRPKMSSDECLRHETNII